MTHRPTPAAETTASAHSKSDALRQLVRILARQAAREAFGVIKSGPEVVSHVD